MKIKIQINGQEVEVSQEEARRIHDELAKLFSGSTVTVYIPQQPVYVPLPYPVYPQPIISSPVWYNGAEITCGVYGGVTR